MIGRSAAARQDGRALLGETETSPLAITSDYVGTSDGRLGDALDVVALPGLPPVVEFGAGDDGKRSRSGPMGALVYSDRGSPPLLRTP